jgi:gliding motility-associated-like protein
MNHGFQLLQTLYASAFGKYSTLRHRYDKAVRNGKFKKLSKRKQSSLISRLRKLYAQLKSFQTQLRLACAGAGLALTLAISNPTQAQNTVGPFERRDAANPFLPPIFFDQPRPAAVDIDGDGDVDVFIGNLDGSIQFFRNDSPPGSVRRFTEVTGTANPFNGVNKGNHAAPAFADIDDDGDLDMLLGINNPAYDPPGGPSEFNYSPTFFFRNTGSATNPVFEEQTGASNPFDGIYGPKYGPALPTFVDMDGDGDNLVDLFISGTYTNDVLGANPGIEYYENQGTASAPNFVLTPHSLNSLTYDNMSVTFADVDTDGDLDAMIGTTNGDPKLFTQDTGVFVYDSQNPLIPFRFTYQVSPVAVDLDGDGDLDFLAGMEDADFFGIYHSNVQYFENSDGDFSLIDRTDLNTSPFGGVDVGRMAAPVFVDLDDDGDMDAVIGAKYTEPALAVYINNNGIFIADQEHPLTQIDPPGFSLITIPVFVDIDRDADRDQDLILCTTSGIEFYRNDNGNYTLESELFLSLKYSVHSIAFIDIDSDNDLDALIGEYYNDENKVTYFENTGSATNPEFSETTAPAPFNNLTFENITKIVGVDLDHDGDTDVVATETYYNGWYGDDNASRTLFFENNGDGTFTEATSPLIIENTPNSLTAFYDLDGDLDLDAFVGNGESFDLDQDGRVFYFENLGSVTESGFTVYNAVSPNSNDNLNSYLRIEGLPANNKVTILNRWGDKVFEMSKYDNDSRRFEGKNDNGKDLPSGTYFYEIEAKGKTFTGYLSVKR